jgi:hypothetical protein
MNRRELRTAVALALVLVGILGSAGAGSSTGPSLPERCGEGELLVSRAAGRFECAEPREVLGTRHCSRGDLLTVDAFGRIECAPRGELAGASPALPRCSRGETLVSDAFGRWECAAR